VILGLNANGFIFIQKQTAAIVSIADTAQNYTNYIMI
jgi:hypothetical protein